LLVLEVDGRASAAAPADNDHVRDLASQVLGAIEVNGQQCLEHCLLSPSQRPWVHGDDDPIGDAVSISGPLNHA
jgi:hypothetical protein